MEIEFWEYLVLPVYLGVIMAVCYFIATANKAMAEYVYFVPAVGAKLLGSLAFAGIYLFHYEGGDTMAYAESAQAVFRLFLSNPGNALVLWFQGYSPETASFFTSDTGYPYGYILNESDTFMVVRVVTCFMFFSFNSYLLSTVLIAFVSVIGPWKLYRTVLEIYPTGRRLLAYAFFFVPSVLFWGSGISKDTITFSAACYLVYAVNRLFVQRRFFSFGTISGLIISFWLILSIKPYIILALMPGLFLWLFFSRVEKIRNTLFKAIVVPFFMVLSIVLVAVFYSVLNDYLGEYSMDNIINKAVTTQEDLKRDYYGGNSFDIGEIERSVPGVLSKFPIATVSGLFRPTLLEVNNIVMLFSALENTVLLLLGLAVFLVKRPIENWKRLLSEPYLVFSLIFSLFLGFSIGLSTANYGALVRFKIPLMPFFVSSLLIIYTRIQFKKQ